MTEELEDAVAWIELHQSVRDHRKISILARHLGIKKPHAIGHCAALWLWSLDNAPDGVIPLDDWLIAEAALWDGDANDFVIGLLAANLIHIESDQYHIHDWSDYAGKLIERRKANAERMRTARAANVPNTSAERVQSDDAHVLGDSTVPNRTEQNSTKIIPLNPPSGESKPEKKSRRKPQLPIPEDWDLTEADADYAEARGLRYERLNNEAEKFYNYWKGRGELRADWSATWRTWVNNWQTGYGQRAAR